MSQPLSLVEQLKSLENLQEIDLKIDQLKKEQDLLPIELKTFDDLLLKLKAQVEQKKRDLVEVEKTHRQSEAALDLNKDRLTRANQKLESVQNSQEFQAATKEIEQLKKANTTLEEQGKTTTVSMDALKEDIKALDQQILTAEQERSEKAVTVTAKSEKFQGEIGSLTGDRKKYVEKVETRILNQYQRVRVARNGLGVVPAVGGRCKGCNMMVPAQLFIEIQRASALHTCPSCHRLLFAPSHGTESGREEKEKGAS